MQVDETNESEFNALIKLLDDPDEGIYTQIKGKLLSYGENAIPALEEAWESSFNALIQKRIEEIVHQLQFDKVLSGFKNWSKLGGRNLLTASILLAKYQYPDLDEKQVENQIEQIKRDIWLELNNNLTALEKVRVLNHIIFEVHGFSGNRTNIHAPQNCFISNVVESKKGNPLSLSLLYAILAQDLDIPLYGVNLPEYFILAYVDEDSILPAFIKEDDRVLFYVNTFSKGSIFGKKEIDLFLKQLKIDPKPEYYQPCSNREIIQRLIISLENAYERLGYTEKKAELELLLKAVSNEGSEE